MLQDYYDQFPIIDNPNLKENLVTCSCGFIYKIYSYADIDFEKSTRGALCPNCKQSTENWKSINYHSAGTFNAMISR